MVSICSCSRGGNVLRAFTLYEHAWFILSKRQATQQHQDECRPFHGCPPLRLKCAIARRNQPVTEVPAESKPIGVMDGHVSAFAGGHGQYLVTFKSSTYSSYFFIKCRNER